MLIGTAVHEKGPDRKAIRDWLAGVGRTRAAFPGATGLIRFDENRDPVNTTVLVGEVTR
jgi:ABC-type branched-subunit amino acid transport system substrate-binding protein